MVVAAIDGGGRQLREALPVRGLISRAAPVVSRLCFVAVCAV